MFAACGLAACNSVDLREPGVSGGGGSTAATSTTSSSTSTATAGGAGGEAGARPCHDSAWIQASEAGAPEGRDYGVVASAGDLCIWSGSQVQPADPIETVMTDGGCYDRETASWRPMSPVGAPSPRVLASASWTGTEILVWGGKHYYLYCPSPDGCPAGPGNNSGARYNPGTDAWAPMSPIGAASPRWGQSTVWTGAEMIVWGGEYPGSEYGDGARYNPALDTWLPIANTGAPSPRTDHFAAWTGSAMLVWGGHHEDPASSALADGALYDPAADSWTPLDSTGAPAPRWYAATAYGAGRLFVWGGAPEDSSTKGFADGYAYSIATNIWTPLPASPLSARRLPLGAWTGKRFLVWGGLDDDGERVSDGALYDPITSTWAPTPPCGPSDSFNVQAVTTPSGVALYRSELWFLDEP